MARITTTHINKLYHAKLILMSSVEGVSDNDLAWVVRVSRQTAYNYRKYLEAFEVKPGKWSLYPTQMDIDYAHVVLERIKATTGLPPAHRKKPTARRKRRA